MYRGASPRATAILAITKPRKSSQHRQPVSTGSFCVFVFWGRVAETCCRCCRGRLPVLLRVPVGSVAAVADAQTKTTGGPRQHSVAALALSARRPAQLPFWTQAEGAAKRSGAASRPGNEVFALLGRTKTGQCPVAVSTPCGGKVDEITPQKRKWGSRAAATKAGWQIGTSS